MHKSLITILVCLGVIASTAQQKAFVPGEIVIRFEIGALDPEFALGEVRSTATPRRYVRAKALDSVLRDETIIELRKALRPLPLDVLNTMRGGQ